AGRGEGQAWGGEGPAGGGGAARSAGGGGGRRQSLVHDPFDGLRATPAAGAAAQAFIDFPGPARSVSGAGQRGADIVVRENVTGADDHGGPIVPSATINKHGGQRRARGNRLSLKKFQSAL